MLIDNVKTGDRIDITYRNPSPAEANTVYVSRVEEVDNKRKVVAQAPFYGGAYIRLPLKKTFSLKFTSERGIARFDAEVEKNMNVDGFRVIAFKLLDDGEKLQRRAFFRFNCAISIQFHVLDANGDVTNETPIEGIIRDIGGGGMRMLSRTILPDNTIIRSVIQLDKDYVVAFGLVLHMLHKPEATHPYQYGIRFESMTTADQERIIQYIYNEQRKALQRPK